MPDSALSTPPRFEPALNVDVLALVGDSVICTDEDGRILVFNQAAEQSFHYSASEVIGEPVERLLHKATAWNTPVRVATLGRGTAAPTA